MTYCSELLRQKETEIKQLNNHIAYMALEWAKTTEELTKLQKQVEAAKTNFIHHFEVLFEDGEITEYQLLQLCDFTKKVLGETTK